MKRYKLKIDNKTTVTLVNDRQLKKWMKMYPNAKQIE